MGAACERPIPGVVNWLAAGVQEHVERRYRERRGRNGGVAAVPVDLAATASVERRWVIAVVGIAQSSAERIDRALNRVGRWPGRLEHNRRNKVLGCVALRVRSLANWD